MKWNSKIHLWNKSK